MWQQNKREIKRENLSLEKEKRNNPPLVNPSLYREKKKTPSQKRKTKRKLITFQEQKRSLKIVISATVFFLPARFHFMTESNIYLC